jgi:hypothetical protein
MTMKKAIGLLVIGILFVLGITGCQTTNEAGEITVPDYPSDVIDWNLYSWQEDGEWAFSIVDRYAGYDSFEQVSADEFKLGSLDHLLEALVNLPDNSAIFWTEHIIPGTVLPPTDLLYDILDYCNSIGVPVVVLN